MFMRMIMSVQQSKNRIRQRKKQQRLNLQLKKKLFGNIFIFPCYYCRRVFIIDQLTIEHLQPLSMEGTNDASNIALACAPCNQERGRESWFLKRKIMRQQYEQHSR